MAGGWQQTAVTTIEAPRRAIAIAARPLRLSEPLAARCITRTAMQPVRQAQPQLDAASLDTVGTWIEITTGSDASD